LERARAVVLAWEARASCLPSMRKEKAALSTREASQRMVSAKYSLDLSSEA